MNKLDVIKKRMSNKKLSKYACTDNEAILLKDEENDIRPRFFRDADRILYSLSYTRYIDKTQVFSFSDNDNISKRMTHVQFVSKIARTIGRGLQLNEDLIEASSLGHDLGHPPFGHEGEKILNEISKKNGCGVFAHNIQSVRTLITLENNGVGKNISVQVLDAILCHNGEVLNKEYYPKKKTKEEFLNEYSEVYKDDSYSKKLIPMTKEGCVVRISDIIAYVGKDLEDAIRLGILKREDLDKSITDVLGNTNDKIVDALVTDVINNSYNKPYIKLSSKVYNALNKLIEYNYKNIYKKIHDNNELKTYEEMYNSLFKSCLKALNNNNLEDDIYKIFLNNMSNDYKNNTKKERIVIDYIAGMTDDFFINEYNKISSIKIKR